MQKHIKNTGIQIKMEHIGGLIDIFTAIENKNKITIYNEKGFIENNGKFSRSEELKITENQKKGVVSEYQFLDRSLRAWVKHYINLYGTNNIKSSVIFKKKGTGVSICEQIFTRLKVEL